MKSSHEVVDTVNVADVESIFYCKPTEPDILIVLMKDGRRLYCDEVYPVQEVPKPLFNVGDTIRSKVWKLAVHEIVFMDDSAYFFENGGMVKFADQEQWELAEEPVSEDLEKAIDTYLATYFGSEKEKQDWPFLKKMAIHFANWQREKMIKNFIEVKVKSDKDGFYTTETWDEMNELLQKIGAKEGDKVYISIIKQEEEE